MTRDVAAVVVSAVLWMAVLSVPVLVVRFVQRRSPFAGVRAVPGEVRTTMRIVAGLLVVGVGLLAFPVSTAPVDRAVWCGPAATAALGTTGPPREPPPGLPPFSALEERVAREHTGCVDAAVPYVGLAAALLAIGLAVALTSWLRAARTIVLVTTDDG